MNLIDGTFQYFYCTRDLVLLPHPDVPTRDVTDTQRAGLKTEPHLEQRIENWCKCRARTITAAVKRARKMATDDCQHYLLLTTRRSPDGRPFVVGLMPFSNKAFERLRSRYPARWSDTGFLPYVSDERMKLVTFSDAFPLSNWMDDEKKRTIPGGQGGLGLVPEELLRRVLTHFSTKPDQTTAFLQNVKVLEKRLKQFNPVRWKEYKSRLPIRGCG